VYNDDADNFFNTVNPQASTGSGPIPGTFAAGGSPRVINNSYVADGTSATPVFSNVDALRRLDYMIASAGTVFVTAAVSQLPDPTTGGTDYFTLNWSAFDSLAVSGSQTFDPSAIPGGAPGKAHADLTASGGDGSASSTTAIVSSFATGLYGSAEASGQNGAMNDTVIRSLLMTGADKGSYTGPFTANHLSVQNGAGTADYAASLAILQGGQEAISDDRGLSTIAATPSATPLRGWAHSIVQTGGNSYLAFHSDGTITGITASLNWDVTQSASPLIGTIDTSDSGNIFANVGLEVVPLTASGGGMYAVGTQSDASLISETEDGVDNEEYLYFTGTLPAGDYAFEFMNSGTVAPVVGFSYSISEVPEPVAGGMGVLVACGWCVRRRRG